MAIKLVSMCNVRKTVPNQELMLLTCLERNKTHVRKGMEKWIILQLFPEHLLCAGPYQGA